MANPNDIKFGPVQNDQPDYWNKNNLVKRDASILDNHFASRSRGGAQWKNGQDPSIAAYAIPKSQKIALKENSVGGILSYDGAVSAWDSRYLQAQASLAGRSPMTEVGYGGGRGMNGEVDAGGILQQRLLSQASNPGGSTHGPMPGHAMATGQQSYQQPSSPMCTLQEGHTFYQPLQIQGFGTTQPLAKSSGEIKGVQGRQFQIEGVVNAYIVDGLQTIDLSKMEPGRLRSLVKVTAPLLGTFLVPQGAIIQEGGGQEGRRLLIDSSQPQQRMDQRAQWAQQQAQQQQNQRGLLISSQPTRQVMPQQPNNRPTNPQEILQQQQRDMLKRRGFLKG